VLGPKQSEPFIVQDRGRDEGAAELSVAGKVVKVLRNACCLQGERIMI